MPKQVGEKHGEVKKVPDKPTKTKGVKTEKPAEGKKLLFSLSPLSPEDWNPPFSGTRVRSASCDGHSADQDRARRNLLCRGSWSSQQPKRCEQTAAGADVQVALPRYVDLLILDEVIGFTLGAVDHRSHDLRAPERNVEIEIDVLGVGIFVGHAEPSSRAAGGSGK